MADPMILNNIKMSVVEEVAEGTAVAESAAGAFIFLADELAFNIDREMIESNEVTGTFTKQASHPGRYSTDLGFTVKFNVRGKGTKSAPEWALLLKSIMGQQNANTDDAVAAAPAPTTSEFTANSGANDFDEGQLIMVNDEVVRINDITGQALTVFPPLTTTPIALDDIYAGISWMLSSDSFSTFTSYAYVKNKSGNERRVRWAGCRATSCTMSFEVGQLVKMSFTVVATSVLYDNTAQGVTPVYDSTTKPIMCLGIGGKTILSGIVKGVPTITETVLTAPNFRTRPGDYIVVDVGSSVYETKLISDVSGDEGEDQTITHAALSGAATATETAYIVHTACGYVTGTLEITIEMEEEPDDCMFASSGFSGRSFLGRSVNISRTPYLEDWSEFLMRDNVVESVLQVVAGDDTNNIFCAHIPSSINAEASLGTDAKMTVEVSGQAVKDAVLGNDHEIVIATF